MDMPIENPILVRLLTGGDIASGFPSILPPAKARISLPHSHGLALATTNARLAGELSSLTDYLMCLNHIWNMWSPVILAEFQVYEFEITQAASGQSWESAVNLVKTTPQPVYVEITKSAQDRLAQFSVGALPVLITMGVTAIYEPVFVYLEANVFHAYPIKPLHIKRG